MIIGIDVGFSRTAATTGVCLIDPGAKSPVLVRKVRTNSKISDLLQDAHGERPAAIGINAPLVLGLTRRYRVRKRYRLCERILSSGAFQKRCKPGPTNSPRGYALHREGTRIANSLLDSFPGTHVYEAFPNAFLGVMLPSLVFQHPIRRAIKSDVFWNLCFSNEKIMKTLLSRLFGCHSRKIFQAAGALRNHDHRAAFVCAISAQAASTGIAASCGNFTGVVQLPPKSLIQPWALQQFSTDLVLPPDD